VIIIGNTYLSDDIAEKMFVCDLEKCQGACCEEGDLGAPLELDELTILDEIFETVKPYMSDIGRKTAEKQGLYLLDSDGDYSTTTVEGRECVFAKKDEKGHWKCSIEQAYLENKINFHKPISCHLYPIRISQYAEYDALNYHHWHICSPACSLGEKLSVPVYQFLKAPLIRKYGEAWYKELATIIEEREKEI
jgi:hypothetical protein